MVYLDLAIDLPCMQEGFRPKDGKLALSLTKANPRWLTEWVVFCIVFQFVKCYTEHVGLNCAMCLMGSVHVTKWWWSVFLSSAPFASHASSLAFGLLKGPLLQFVPRIMYLSILSQCAT